MLVLSRKAGESVRIGEHVRVTIASVSGSHVRIAIDAPDSITIHREEVFERIVAANREAAQVRCENLEALEEASSKSRGRQGEGVRWRSE